MNNLKRLWLTLSFFGAAWAMPAPCFATGSISISGNPPPFVISTAVAGSQPTSVANASTSYSITPPQVISTRKITGQLNTLMPNQTSLAINLAAPSGAVSQGSITLSAIAQDLVKSITLSSYSNAVITYSFSALASAGVISSTSRTVTLTITLQ